MANAPNPDTIVGWMIHSGVSSGAGLLRRSVFSVCHGPTGRRCVQASAVGGRPGRRRQAGQRRETARPKKQPNRRNGGTSTLPVLSQQRFDAPARKQPQATQLQTQHNIFAYRRTVRRPGRHATIKTPGTSRNVSGRPRPALWENCGKRTDDNSDNNSDNHCELPGCGTKKRNNRDVRPDERR